MELSQRIIFVSGIFLLFLRVTMPTGTLENVALQGIATESYVAYSGVAHNAIDGNRNPVYSGGSCTYTDLGTNPWWKVDLLNEYSVTVVTITNRADHYPKWINGAEIRIGNSLKNNGINNPR
ncbi:hypothetical protein DPEC_G00096750 [Dallia pectoralis]|uniref:Uncharacterized protein n=1 Tax=Dallia pectoralis TaxID=75939 RepID=A0ACC2GVU6_DALPE|nr:hypothetical protein DPEC_G00096750 [Dallia pectoralis]